MTTVPTASPPGAERADDGSGRGRPADPSVARPGEFAPLTVGPLTVWPPVVLAPMAGITNAPFRALCRARGAGLYVSEMITSRGVVEGSERTAELARFDRCETTRSLQLYGTDPAVMGEAVRRLVDGAVPGVEPVHHIDMNFGCPVRKITRHGGGAALPFRRRLFAAVVGAAVEAAGSVPVTVKFRTGIDDEHLTYLDAGRIAADVGASAVALHARSAEQLYSGRADWDAVARLKAHVRSIPVLGNGDVWTGADAVRMMRHTGCDGVVVGRGCLGRPWLFADLGDAFDGRPSAPPPRLGEVIATMRDHAERLVAWWGPDRGIRDFRKHTGWYLHGYPVGPVVRRRLNQAASLAEAQGLLDGLDPDITCPAEVASGPRGHSHGPRRVTVPSGWLDDPDDDVPVGPDAESVVSGG
jgi:nifR3 family TIM-barrel protein